MAEERTALVLSAGGLNCAYQAGAFKALWPYLRPDLVVGVSGGALNGWPIAGGCTPDYLIESWLEPAVSDVLRVVSNPGLINGYFDSMLLRAQTEKAVAEFQPQVPFGVALVEVPSLRTVLFQSPEVTAKHLQASCSIPLFLPSVVIKGKRYVDGGLFEKVPVHGAIEMGATRIIAVDSMPEIDLWWLRMGVVAAHAFRSRRKPPAGIPIITISPSETLGDTRSAVFWKRENIERWIDLGFRDASRVAEELEAAGYFAESGTSK